MKFAAEKATRMLLAREPAAEALIFTGASGSHDPSYRDRLRLDTQEQLQKMVARTWQHWIAGFETTVALQSLAPDPALYEQAVRETQAREA